MGVCVLLKPRQEPPGLALLGWAMLVTLAQWRLFVEIVQLMAWEM